MIEFTFDTDNRQRRWRPASPGHGFRARPWL